MATPVFSLKRSKDGQYYFNLHAANNEIILTSRRYRMRGVAVNAIVMVKDNALVDQHYERLPTGDQHYFVLRSGDGQILGTSERYTTRAARDKGIEAVKRCAPEAEIREVEGELDA
ncbi:MAG TPA: YegP family protein [Polyangiaceae bacterium]|nr:YegP family protein [Polyangiaceae bacterium]